MITLKYIILPVFSNFLLVSTGSVNVGNLKNTEVLNFDSKDAQVPTYQNHLKSMNGATGGFLENKFITCGGFGGELLQESFINECYKIETNVTSFHGNMKEKRHHAASIVMGKKLWILGGEDENYDKLKTTEYISHDGKQEDGPDLPIGLMGHAVIQINEYNFMLVGGTNSDGFNSCTNKTWFYSNGNWKDGPTLTNKRTDHSVGQIRDSITQDSYIVVSGGLDGSKSLKDTEILKIGGSAWKTGKLL